MGDAARSAGIVRGQPGPRTKVGPSPVGSEVKVVAVECRRMDPTGNDITRDEEEEGHLESYSSPRTISNTLAECSAEDESISYTIRKLPLVRVRVRKVNAYMT
jgi:hypothetical protein